MTDETKPPQNFTRRRILGAAAIGGAAVAGSALASSMLGGAAPGEGEIVISDALPPNLRARLTEQAATGTPTGTIADVKHIVLLMMENRSFDHYFGTLPGVKGFSDPDAITLSTGRSVFHQPYSGNADGYLLPFRMDTSDTNAQWVESTSHNWRCQHGAWNNGAMDNWLPAHQFEGETAEEVERVMGYHTREDIPFHYALADAFTICDRYHSSIMSSTQPNRLMWETGNIDVNGNYEGPVLGQSTPAHGYYTWPTYAEQLYAANVGFNLYQFNPGMKSALNNFAAFHDSNKPQLNGKLATTTVAQFLDDCRNDNLRRVNWVYPPKDNTEHPTTSSPAAGAKFIYDVLDAIAYDPEVWAKTVFILVYDENDGFFDHVVPPTPPATAVGEFVNGDSPIDGIHGRGWPCGAGFRVPCIIVSPWTAGGWVCSEPFDHTSCNRFIEAVTGVATRFISPWRRATFGNLTSAFRFGDPAAAKPDISTFPNAAAALAEAETHRNDQLPRAPAIQTVPAQEPGTKPRVP